MARTVLLADDSVTAQNMGRRILIDAGYEVVTVNNGSAALKKAHETRPDLIVLDVYMPGYGGLEVCQRLKESEQTARIPILLSVGKMEPFKPEEARRARADAHIVKPFEASELLAALTRLEDRIVPQPHSEPSRVRKSKSEKRSRLSRVTDPTMSFDDTQSDKIAYLAQVKQRRSAAEAEGPHSREVGNGEAETPSGPAQSFAEEEMATASAPSMPMPMSVYAARQLQELPVVAEPAPIEQDSVVRQEEIASSEHKAEVTAVEALSPAAETSSASIESSPANTDSSPPAVNGERTPTVIESVASLESQPPKEGATSTAAVAAEPSVAASGAEVAASANELVKSQEVPAESPQTTKIRWVAENVALTAEEAALELEREMQAISAQSTSAAASEGGVVREQPEASTPVESPKSEEAKGATFAAAASASSSSAVGTTVPEAEAEPPVPSEAAAAWENWQHIRDSVMGSQASLPQSVTEEAQGSVPEATARAVPDNVPAQAKSTEAPADGDSDNAAISSIVDSVLAELKPKLMAEISKKLKK